MYKKLVSIIMPAYNGEAFIGQAINSVLDQSHVDWELLIIDDGSTDNTADVVDDFKDKRIRYVFQENQGQAVALNHGLELAKGDFVTTLDVDDWYTPNSLLDRVEFLVRHPEYGVVYGDGYYCDASGKVLKNFSQNLPEPLNGDVYEVLINNSFFGTGSNVMVRRDVFEEYQLRYDTTIKYCQDYDLYVRMAERVAFGSVGTHTVWYRIHENNMTSSMSDREKKKYQYRAAQKILRSERFMRVSLYQKINYISGLLQYVLLGNEEEQLKIINCEHFQDFPAHVQGRLLRLTANRYIIDETNRRFAKQLLSMALSVYPRDMKTHFVRFLFWFNPSVAGRFLGEWKEHSRSSRARGALGI